MTVSSNYLQELHRLMDRPRRYRFGELELTTVPNRLTRNGRRIVLQPQPARALELLIRHRGRIVTRDMLRDHLWGEGTYLDHEQGINFALRKIRVALGDSPSAPRFVETVPRVGYRFVAPVEELPIEEDLEQASETTAPSSEKRPGANASEAGFTSRGLWGRHGRRGHRALRQGSAGCRSRLGCLAARAQLAPGT